MAAWFGKHALILNLGVVLAFAVFVLIGSLSRAANPAGTAEKPGSGEKAAAAATTWQGSVKMFAAALAIGSTAPTPAEPMRLCVRPAWARSRKTRSSSATS